MAAQRPGIVPRNTLVPPAGSRVPVYRSAALSSMEAGKDAAAEIAADRSCPIRGAHPSLGGW